MVSISAESLKLIGPEISLIEGRAYAMRAMRYLLFAFGLLILTAQFATVGAENVQRTVRGTVIATNTSADPQTVVVKVMLPNKEALIVGADVPTDTKITRGKRAARLADLTVGEAAEITYLKSPDGLIARSIHVQ